MAGCSPTEASSSCPSNSTIPPFNPPSLLPSLHPGRDQSRRLRGPLLHDLMTCLTKVGGTREEREGEG
jgi:hypothetical protein